MTERPPNWFQKGLSDLAQYFSESDSEESRPKRNRVRTAQYIDEVPTPQVAKLIAKKRKTIQQRQAHLADFKRLSVASEPDRASETHYIIGASSQGW